MDIHIPLPTLREAIAFGIGLFIGAIGAWSVIKLRKTGRERTLEILREIEITKLKRSKLP